MTNTNLSMNYKTFVAWSEYSAGTTLMSKLIYSFIVDNPILSGNSSAGQHICYLQTLTNGQYVYIQLNGAMQTYNLRIQDS